MTEGVLEPYFPRNSSQPTSQGWKSFLDGGIRDANTLSGKEDLMGEQG